MPKKAIFHKQQIFDKAFEIFEKEGLEVITARNLGKALKASPAPIYAHYESINDLKTDLIDTAKAQFLEYLKRPFTDLIFLNIGMGICVFARENRSLFSSIFLKEQSFSDIIRQFRDVTKAEINKDHRFDDIPENLKDDTLFDCWTFAHGYATLIATGFIDPSDEEIKRRLLAGPATILYKRIEDYNNSK